MFLRFIGGQIFSIGAVQEEILFLRFPEAIVARLFTEVFNAKEAMRIYGKILDPYWLILHSDL